MWVVDLDPTVGREQAKTRPCLIVSADAFNESGAELVLAAPITPKASGRIPWHVEVRAGEGGLRRGGHVMCEAVRSVSKERLKERWDTADDYTLRLVADKLMVLFDLY